MADFNFRDLKADEIECRVSQINGNGLTLLLYKDARCDMNILDETVGPMNWQRHHDRNNANCTVSLWDPDKTQWISKEDTGTESNTEAEKGLASDSFKRACFNWGIGRELYTAPRIWISKDCYNPEQKNGKWVTYDRFKVQSITIEAKKITALTILNETMGNIVFELSNGRTRVTAAQNKKTASRKQQTVQAPAEIIGEISPTGEPIPISEEQPQAPAPDPTPSRGKLREYCERHGIDRGMIRDMCGLGPRSTEKDYQAALSYAEGLASMMAQG